VELTEIIKEIIRQYEEGLITEMEMTNKIINECLRVLEGSN
jgi:hypothetical protein